MSVIYHIIEKNNRKNTEDARPEKEKKGDNRNPKNDYFTTAQLDQFSEFINLKFTILGEYVKDKEKKKLTIVASSFAVFSLLTTILLGMFTGATSNLNNLVSLPFLMLLVIFLSGIAAINTSIIKYIISLKLEWIHGIRQINCIRQAQNSVLFARIEGYYPRLITKDMVEKKDYDRTIIDRNTKYWRLYGRHEKFPLNNVHLREKYRSLKVLFIWFRSTDFFAATAMALFTISLVVAPIFYLQRGADEIFKIPGITENDIEMINMAFIIIGITFVILVLASIVSSIYSFNKTLNQDETFHITPSGNTNNV